TPGGDGNFYGTTYDGGSSNGGVIYRLRRGAYLQSFGLTNNGFVLNYINVGGSGTVVLAASSDLVSWTPILTNGAIVRQFVDTSAHAKSQQFYRMCQQ